MSNYKGATLPYATTLVASAARTATGNSGAILFPTDQVGGEFIVNITAASGTSPTLDLAIQVTPNDGTTFFTQWRFSQSTGAEAQRIITTFRRVAEVGAETAIADTGGALANNAPITRKIRVLWTIGGTNPSFTFAVYFIGDRGTLE